MEGAFLVPLDGIEDDVSRSEMEDAMEAESGRLLGSAGRPDTVSPNQVLRVFFLFVGDCKSKAVKSFNSCAREEDEENFDLFCSLCLKSKSVPEDFMQWMSTRHSIYAVASSLFLLPRGREGVGEFCVWNEELDALMSDILSMHSSDFVKSLHLDLLTFCCASSETNHINLGNGESMHDLLTEICVRLKDMKDSADALMTDEKQSIVGWWRGNVPSSVVVSPDKCWAYALCLLFCGIPFHAMADEEGPLVSLFQIMSNSESGIRDPFFRQFPLFLHLVFGCCMDAPVSRLNNFPFYWK